MTLNSVEDIRLSILRSVQVHGRPSIRTRGEECIISNLNLNRIKKVINNAQKIFSAELSVTTCRYLLQGKKLILALKKVPSYRKLGTENLLSIVYDLLYSIRLFIDTQYESANQQMLCARIDSNKHERAA